MKGLADHLSDQVVSLLSLFMAERDAESFRGDLEERFQKRQAAGRSKLSASMCSVAEVGRSLPTLLLSALTNPKEPRLFWRSVGFVVMLVLLVLSMAMPRLYLKQVANYQIESLHSENERLNSERKTLEFTEEASVP